MSKHIRFAHSTKYENPELFFDGKTAEELVELALKNFDKLGYRIVQRNLIKPTTTLKRTLLLGKNFKDYSVGSHAAILWHEIVHAYQWRDKSYSFPFLYIRKRWQWALELQGYRQQVRVIRALKGDELARRFAIKVPSIMQKRPYMMRRLDPKHIDEETLRAFEKGLPGLKLL